MAKYKGKHARSRRDEDELDRSYRDLAGTKKKCSNVIPALICLLVLAVLILVVVGLSSLLMRMQENTATIGNITAAGVNLRGMTPEEAADALRRATQDTYSRTSMVIETNGSTTELSPALTGASLDVAGVVDAASAYTSTDAEIMDILPYLSLDTGAVREAVEQLSQKYNAEVTDSSYTVEGQAPSDGGAGQTLVVTVGTPGYRLDGEKLYEKIMLAYNNNTFTVESDCAVTEPASLNLDSIYQQYYVAPVDAVEDPQTHEITEGTDGYGFDLETARASLESAGYGDVIRIPFGPLTPEVTAESLVNSHFQDVLAAYHAPYDPEETDIATNLRLACEAINGTVVYPGEIFSYNAALGERTEEKGYRPGPTYIGGQTVDTIGGGICEVASVLYYCTLLADLEPVDRICHMFAPTYVPLGMDATVSWGSLDFQFRNSSDNPLRIEAVLTEDEVLIRLMGTDNRDYYVKMEYEIIRSEEYKTTYRDLPADNADGYQDGDEIISPYTGYYVDTYRCKYDRQTDELLSRTYEDSSSYDRRDAVICRIQEEETTPPTEATEAASTPAPTVPSSDIVHGGGVSEDPGDY